MLVTSRRSLLFSLILFCCMTAMANEIAVNKLVSNGINDEEAVFSLDDVIRSELAKTGKYNVMERANINTILEEQQFQQSDACDASSCAVEIGQLLGVRQIVVGSIGKVGKTYTMNLRLIDVSTGKIVKDVTEYHKGELDGLLTEVIPTVVQKLAGTYKKKSNALKYGLITSAALAVVIPTAWYFTMYNKDSEESAQDETFDMTVSW
ncbi:MAG: DUF2380 domain-containing protein [Fibrobacteria bacterium]|nr:DUF2380 domain-containing protein [Fibrobacteria bacterium]